MRRVEPNQEAASDRDAASVRRGGTQGCPQDQQRRGLSVPAAAARRGARGANYNDGDGEPIDPDNLTTPKRYAKTCRG